MIILMEIEIEKYIFGRGIEKMRLNGIEPLIRETESSFTENRTTIMRQPRKYIPFQPPIYIIYADGGDSKRNKEKK